MASLTLLNHSIRSSSLPKTALSTKTPFSQCLSSSSSSSRSQLYGLKLSSSSSSVSFPSTSSKKFYISAKKGSVPPAFTLKDQDNKNVSLSKFKGKPVVLYFYPADESPGCTKQACAFRDSYEKFKKAGAQVVGVSGDSPESHKVIMISCGQCFVCILSIFLHSDCRAGSSDLFGALGGRQTYVLDKNLVVQYIYNNQFQTEKHIDETLKILQSL
ncbi:hypothetical protein C5167_029026 [Papaver somniferum]|nr:hypothetical protein C5167_029026 [Papaver somniferum]